MRIQPLNPFGAVVESTATGLSLLDVSKDRILELLDQYLLLVFRNFQSFSDREYIVFSGQFGRLLAWEFGEILELKIDPEPANHIFSAGRVELHWDGAFVAEKPHYNVFQCMQGSPSSVGGNTLFVNALDVWSKASVSERDHWQRIAIDYAMEKKAHYGGIIHRKLVDRHQYKPDQNVIRYIEAFNEDSEKINPMEVNVNGLTKADSDIFLRGFTWRLYRSDVMYQHTWETGDFLIADNASLLHGRSRFLSAQASRHIKRINIL